LPKARHGAEDRNLSLKKIPSAKVGFFRHYFRVFEKKARKMFYENIFLFYENILLS